MESSKRQHNTSVLSVLCGSTRPRHLAPPAAYCLPLISAQNNVFGSCMKHLTVTVLFDPLNPYVLCRSRVSKDFTSAIQRYKDVHAITADDLIRIERFRFELEVHLSNYFQQTVQLEVYGSTLNGFGVSGADIDMSLSFMRTQPRWANHADIVMRFAAKALVDYPKTLDEQFISAKVPIVRFKGIDSDMEADISFENGLALHNTRLLQQYCKWDERRVPALGIWVKAWAKRCGICDASKGSLSSYAWIIMMLHYLQSLEPYPLVPFLQIMGNRESQRLYDYDIYYSRFVDVYHCNKVPYSLHSLFVGFLEYYANYFDFRATVVQVKSKGPMAIPEKWRCPINIMDPFELDHNLGQSVDASMLSYIRKCLLHSIRVFTSGDFRTQFLTSKGLPLNHSLPSALLDEFADELLRACRLSQEPPIRSFRERTFSQSTSSTGRSSD